MAEVRKRTRARAMDLEGHEGTVEVFRARYHRNVVVGQPVERMEKIRVPLFTQEPGRVSVTGSVTRNLGEFNSVKVAVTVALPCYAERSEVIRAYQEASEMVDQFLMEEGQAAGIPVAPAAPEGSNGSQN